MKSLFCLVGLCLLWSLSVAHADKVKSKKKAETVQVIVRTTHGSKLSQFYLQSIKGEATLKFTSNAAATKSRKLSEKDFGFLMDEINKLPANAKVPKNCYRARMDVVVKSPSKKPVAKSSCFGIDSPTSAKFVRFANILSVAM